MDQEQDLDKDMWTRDMELNISSDAYKSDRHCFEPLLDSEIPKTCPEGDSQANGGAEMAVREVKDQVCAVRSLLESKLGQKLPEDVQI